MARPPSIPQYPKKPHRSGQARITLGGKDVYLGPHGTPESRAAYERAIADWLARKGRPQPQPNESGVSVKVVLAAYMQHAENHYIKCGKPTAHLARLKCAFGPLRDLYGPTPAAEFRAKHLLSVREAMIARGWTRDFINECVSCIKTAWDWAVLQEFVPVSNLRSLRGLRLETAGVTVNEPVPPVPWEDVQRTIPHLLHQLADLVRVQYLAAMRPCEVCGIRRRDLRLDGYVDGVGRFPGLWVYEVEYQFNKNAHRRQRRVVLLGPNAQLYLTPYLDRPTDAFMFSPAEAMELWLRGNHRPLVFRDDRPPGEHYTKWSYGRAIVRARNRAGTDWAPNQLRHTRATEIRSLYTPDHARIVLGHTLPGVTGEYALADLGKAAEVMRAIG